ncbi:MAG: TolC family protein [Gemmataceae bacterium]|nr:TolC family protein [Gemmataceae bacterium]
MPSHSSKAGCAPRSRFAVRLAFGFLLTYPGCAFFHNDVPITELTQRILAPDGMPAAANLDSAPRLTPPPAETLPRPRRLPLDEGDNPKPDAEESDTTASACEPPAGAALSLDRAVELAWDYNPGLDVMRERIVQARGGKQVAFAEFLPQAKGSYRHIVGETTANDFTLPTLPTYVGNVTFGGASDRFNLSELNVQWTLWDFGRTPGRFGQAVSAVEIAQLQYVRARQTVAFNTTAAYLSLLQAHAVQVIAEEAVRRAESFLRDARNFLRRGTAIRNDVLRADVLLADMRLNLVKARTAEALAVAALNQTIGINVSAPTKVVDQPEAPPFDLELAQALQLAVDNRQEFGVVLQAVRSARLGTGVAQADFLPRVFVGGVGAHLDGAGLPESNLAAGGVNIELALFDGGRRLGKLRSAESEVRGAIAQGKEICDRIAFEVNAAYLSIVDARERILVSRTAVTQATENLRVVKSLFERGDAVPTDVVDGELALTRAQQNLATARYDYQTALARLQYAVGTGWVGGATVSDAGCRTKHCNVAP